MAPCLPLRSAKSSDKSSSKWRCSHTFQSGEMFVNLCRCLACGANSWVLGLLSQVCKLLSLPPPQFLTSNVPVSRQPDHCSLSPRPKGVFTQFWIWNLWKSWFKFDNFAWNLPNLSLLPFNKKTFWLWTSEMHTYILYFFRASAIPLLCCGSPTLQVCSPPILPLVCTLHVQ